MKHERSRFLIVLQRGFTGVSTGVAFLMMPIVAYADNGHGHGHGGGGGTSVVQGPQVPYAFVFPVLLIVVAYFIYRRRMKPD